MKKQPKKAIIRIYKLKTKNRALIVFQTSKNCFDKHIVHTVVGIKAVCVSRISRFNCIVHSFLISAFFALKKS